MNSSNTETELAFSIHGDPTTLRNHRLLSGDEKQTRQIVGTYFDTPGNTLAEAGWSLRIRRIDDQWLQTVKGPKTIATGPEWEVELDSANDRRLDFKALQQTPIWSLIDGQEHELRPVFETDVRRTTLLLQLPNATIETALDQGQIRSFKNPHVLPIHDVELELKAGEAAMLFQSAIALALDSEIMIQPASKAARGYQLNSNEPLAARKHADVKLDREFDTGACLQAILINCLTHLRQNLAPAYEGIPDGIHQARVGLRRLRTALRFFANVLPQQPTQTFQLQLKHYSKMFGEVRDWDVFISKTLTGAAHDMPHTHWLELARHAATTERAEAFQQVRKAMQSKGFNSLILSIMAWTEEQPASGAWSDPDPLHRPSSETMPRLLNRYAERCETRRNRLDGSDEAFHDLRKTMKEFRYAMEFAETLYSHKAVRKYLEPCKQIQEDLGRFNDFSTADRLLADLVQETPAIAPAVSELLPWTQAAKRRANRALPKLLRRLNDERPFWH